ncbi:terminase [Variovorax sp. PMC12]|uniref:terminase n=1 Tax=Variovorax sp. PMC12 TaxID=2126319 RepID=UPI0018FF09CA|nr:terminase [Variovorax sp. PMC12]
MAKIVSDTPLLPLPTDAEELKRCLADPEWRLFSGCLYKIMIKGDDKVGPRGVVEEGESFVLPFKPNAAQRRFIKRLWHRNLILKARQLGFTTLVAILWLDHALFNADQRCGIIAQDREAAEAIFADKVKFGYDNLPAEIRERFPLARDSQSQLKFAHNNSSVRVATSMRSGTIHRLHVSEFGKICAKFPDKAAEVVTGSIPAVPKSGVLVIESTAEGRDGDFYKMSQKAQAQHQSKRELTERDYRFHFYAWHSAPEYRMDPAGVIITDKDKAYFDKVEADMDVTLDAHQRAWYVATREADFSGAEEKMWQEYPSTPDEAFQVSTEGTYYAAQMAAARKEGRITALPHMPGIPVDTFWDIGLNDETAIWFHQKVGIRHHWLRYYEASGEPPSHFVLEMQKMGYVWGRHYLPHDGAARRIQGNSTKSYSELLADLGVTNIEIVDRIQAVTTGIQLVRGVLPNCWFDEKGCSEGLAALQAYRKEWNSRLGVWSDYPRHDRASNGADAFRQFAQGYREVFAKGEKPKSWRDRLKTHASKKRSAQAA